ncbi:hypothetical protein M514_15430 [Trichuris suis]|uniref:Uncharacterized protein n=1 Tax=Trichuris suis TaxID=68888 RepID=A0A085NSZ8_9BILA|nr:hypothetical protein M514_15430 [Trichuris suis]
MIKASEVLEHTSRRSFDFYPLVLPLMEQAPWQTAQEKTFAVFLFVQILTHCACVTALHCDKRPTNDVQVDYGT